MRADASGEGNGLAEARLDLGKMTPHVTFLNNLEKDAMYNRFGSSLSELLQTYPGRCGLERAREEGMDFREWGRK